MNKLDKQFEEVMKAIQIDSPSFDFTIKVMSRIKAEAAVSQHSLIENYQPVISRRTWIILIVAFVLFLAFIIISGNTTDTSGDLGLWSYFSKSLPEVDAQASLLLKKSTGVFTNIPLVAYLILIASLALWTLDSIFVRFRHTPSKIT